MESIDTSKLNRFEVIDHRDIKKGTANEGRTVVVPGPAYKLPANVTIDISVQDDGRTLKVFLSDKE